MLLPRVKRQVFKCRTLIKEPFISNTLGHTYQWIFNKIVTTTQWDYVKKMISIKRLIFYIQNTAMGNIVLSLQQALLIIPPIKFVFSSAFVFIYKHFIDFNSSFSHCHFNQSNHLCLENNHFYMWGFIKLTSLLFLGYRIFPVNTQLVYYFIRDRIREDEYLMFTKSFLSVW